MPLMLQELINIYTVVLSMLFLLSLLLLFKKNSVQYHRGTILVFRVNKSHWDKFLTECNLFE